MASLIVTAPSVPASKVATRFDRSRMAVTTLAEPFGGVGYRPRHNHHAPAGAEDARAVERVELTFSVLDVHNEAMRQAALDLGEPIAQAFRRHFLPLSHATVWP
jgi:hypothetical protein